MSTGDTCCQCPKKDAPNTYNLRANLNAMNAKKCYVSPMLFDEKSHTPLTNIRYRENDALDFLEELRTAAEGADDGDQFWREHPLEQDAPTNPDPAGFLTSFYFGAAGTLWALKELGSKAWRAERAEPLWAAHTANPDEPARKPGLLLGDLGIALVCWQLSKEAKYADLAHAAACAAIEEPELELLWGAPGAILVARHMLEATGDPRWRNVILDGAKHLLGTWKCLPSGTRLWTQDLYGSIVQYQGAGHGFAGNAGSLLAALPELTGTERQEILAGIATTTENLAIREEGLVNWKTSVTDGQPAGRFLVQWCHGAPGFITALARFSAGHSASFDATLLAAGNLIWRAGPLKKLFGICHGTAGNAYAFLSLFQRTSDEIWLDRAKAFAAHAIGQSQAGYEKYGRRRWSFHSGDLGLGVFLADLTRGGTTLYPGIDRF